MYDYLPAVKTHHELALAGEVATKHTLKGVVALALAEGSSVDVRGEEADGRQDSAVECGLEVTYKLRSGPHV